jgi:hypothetical protein
MKMTSIAKFTICLMSIFTSASLVAAPQTAKQMVAEMQQYATKPTYLPKGSSVVMFSKQGSDTLVVADNPRWVVKGELYDMWQNKKIANLSELELASKLIPLDSIKIDMNNLFHISTNTDKDLELVVFLDPFKDTTPKDLETILRYADGYKLKFVLFTKDKQALDVKRLFTLACDMNGLPTNKKLALIMNHASRVGDIACEQEKVVGSYGATSVLSVTQSPTLVSSSYIYSEGFPKNLTSWLLENMK